MSKNACGNCGYADHHAHLLRGKEKIECYWFGMIVDWNNRCENHATTYEVYKRRMAGEKLQLHLFTAKREIIPKKEWKEW